MKPIAVVGLTLAGFGLAYLALASSASGKSPPPGPFVPPPPGPFVPPPPGPFVPPLPGPPALPVERGPQPPFSATVPPGRWVATFKDLMVTPVPIDVMVRGQLHTSKIPAGSLVATVRIFDALGNSSETLQKVNWMSPEGDRIAFTFLGNNVVLDEIPTGANLIAHRP